jgi:hypothetical protein
MARELTANMIREAASIGTLVARFNQFETI